MTSQSSFVSRSSPEGGFTMVEVLVAIVILSIGILGAVGMQVSAIRMNKEVRYQATALTLARELAEKMRGNKDVAIQTTAAANPFLLNTTLGSTAPSAPGTNCYTGQCTAPIDIAKWDVYDWQLRMLASLPSPRIVVCMDADPYDAIGQPRWACSNSGTIATLKVAWNRANTMGDTDFTATGTTLPMLVLPLTAGSNE